MNSNLTNHALFLIERLSKTGKTSRLTETDWEILLRQARASGLLERLSVFSIDKGFFSAPDYVIKHFESAIVFFTSQQRILHWELSLLTDVFKQLQMPLILLKGSAYVAADLEASCGRIFNDIDILVPAKSLEKVKNTLAWHGWFPEPLDEYDQRYYLRWMHELPPMRNIERNTSLDIHHNILPITCRFCPDSDKLLEGITQVPGTDYWVLKPEDMILHSASHLFLGGEFERGLRDLSDIDLLLRQFNEKDPDFCQKLVERSQELGLQLPLTYALRYTKEILETDVPDEILFSLVEKETFKKKVEDFLFIRALMPDHPSCNDRWTGLARFLLYIRSHWLRMPLYLLIPHLLRKGWMRISGKAGH